MSIRQAKNRMTGLVSRSVEVSLGKRNSGKPQIRLQGSDSEKYVCLDRADLVRELICDLGEALRHLEADRVFSSEVCLEAELAVEKGYVRELVAQRDRVMTALEGAGVHRDLVIAIALGKTGEGPVVPR